jgi:hypothetical protein
MPDEANATATRNGRPPWMGLMILKTEFLIFSDLAIVGHSPNEHSPLHA